MMLYCAVYDIVWCCVCYCMVLYGAVYDIVWCCVWYCIVLSGAVYCVWYPDSKLYPRCIVLVYWSIYWTNILRIQTKTGEGGDGEIGDRY